MGTADALTCYVCTSDHWTGLCDVLAGYGVWDLEVEAPAGMDRCHVTLTGKICTLMEYLLKYLERLRRICFAVDSDGTEFVDRGFSSSLDGEYPGVLNNCDVSHGLFNTSTSVCFCTGNLCNNLKHPLE